MDISLVDLSGTEDFSQPEVMGNAVSGDSARLTGLGFILATRTLSLSRASREKRVLHTRRPPKRERGMANGFASFSLSGANHFSLAPKEHVRTMAPRHRRAQQWITYDERGARGDMAAESVRHVRDPTPPLVSNSNSSSVSVELDSLKTSQPVFSLFIFTGMSSFSCVES